jgi:hypothetical protein
MRVLMSMVLTLTLAALVLRADAALAQQPRAAAAPAAAPSTQPAAAAAPAAAPRAAAPPASVPPAVVPRAAAPPGEPPAAEPYTYQALGRRDPFVSVLGMGGEPRLTSKSGQGPAGMLTSEISVRGTMQNGSVFIALIQGPDNKTYVVRGGDKLLDGTVKAVTSQGLTVVQDVNDPLSLVKTREIHKLLRSLEDAKQ